MLHWMDINRTFADMGPLRTRMDLLLDRALREEVGKPRLRRVQERGGFVARLDEEGHAYVLRAEIPGIPHEGIDLQVTPDGLTLRAERKVAVPERTTVHRQERRDLQLSQSWTLPTRIDPDAVTAELVNGLLTVRLPKAAEVLPRRISVQAA